MPLSAFNASKPQRHHGLLLGGRDGEAGARKMHTNLADLAIAAPDDDLMDARGDQFADDRIASGIVRSDGNRLARLPADGISRVGGSRWRLMWRSLATSSACLRGHWAPPAVADRGDALGPAQQPRKAIERRRRWSEILLQEPNRMVGGEIGEAGGGALQERRGRRPASDPANRNARAADRAGSALPPSLRRDRYFGRRIWLGLQEIPRATRRASSRTAMPAAGLNVVFSAHQASASAAPRPAG